jgi:chemotaxis protein CheX
MQMKYVNPFIESFVNVLSTMASTQVTQGDASVKKDNNGVVSGDITSSISFTGDQANGSIVISFTEPAILDIVSNMLGEKKEKITDEIADMASEIANMVSGGGRKKMSVERIKFEATRPATVIGKDQSVNHSVNGEIVVVPFKSDAGEMTVEICFVDSAG